MTYAELTQAIKDWLDDQSLPASQTDMFIELAESRINKMLRVREMSYEQVVDPMLVVDSKWPLPNDFIGSRSISVDGRDLDYLTPEQMNNTQAKTDVYYYSIVADMLWFKAAPSDTADIRVLYYRKLPPIKLNDSNWLSQTYPDIYLYASLLEANLYLYDAAKAAQMKQVFDQSVSDLVNADRSDRWSGGTMRTRVQF